MRNFAIKKKMEYLLISFYRCAPLKVKYLQNCLYYLYVEHFSLCSSNPIMLRNKRSENLKEKKKGFMCVSAHFQLNCLNNVPKSYTLMKHKF